MNQRVHDAGKKREEAVRFGCMFSPEGLLCFSAHACTRASHHHACRVSGIDVPVLTVSEWMQSYDPAKADAKLLAAGERHAALLKETQDKAIQMNSRVSEAEKKREGVAGHDLSKTEAKLQAAEERHSAIIKETQEKAAAEVAKAKELAEKKAAKLQEMDDNLKAKMCAAEDRRNKLIAESKVCAHFLVLVPELLRSLSVEPSHPRARHVFPLHALTFCHRCCSIWLLLHMTVFPLRALTWHAQEKAVMLASPAHKRSPSKREAPAPGE